MATTATEAGKAWYSMSKIEQLLFGFAGAVTIVVRHAERHHSRQLMADVDAFVEGVLVTTDQLNLLRRNARVDFCVDASKEHEHIPWEKHLLHVTHKTREALDALEAEAIIGAGTNNGCGLVTYTAAELQHQEIPPLRWIVPGMIPEGLMVFAGKSGLGKSYFALQVGAAVASGGQALGCIPVEQGEVLYCALEDGPRRMQFRMQQSTEDGPAWPSEMHFTHHAPRIDEGLGNRLRLWLQEHLQARLIMLDVLVKIQSPRHRGDDQYAGAYGDLGPLQALALEFHIAIMVLHHTNKLASPDDPLDAVLGSTGIVGTADVKAVLTRARTENTACLFITGRDVQERRIALDFSSNKWTLTDEAVLSATAERKEIMALLDETMEIMKPKEIAIATKREEGATRVLLRKMLDDGQVASPKYGGYCSIKHSSNTRNSCYESRSSGSTNCYRPPVTLRYTGNSSSESLDVLPSEELPLDEELLTHGNASIGHPGGLRGKSDQSYCHDTDQNLLGVAPDMADVFGTVDLTPIDDEPPADMLLTPHDPTADISPAQRRAELTSRVHKVATVLRPKPLADTQKVSRTKAAGPNKAPWMFGNWTVKNALPSDEPPSRADTIGEHRTNGVGGHDDVEVF